MDEFLKELKALLQKHNIEEIYLASADCSDWHGIYDARMEIESKTAVYKFNYDMICPEDMHKVSIRKKGK